MKTLLGILGRYCLVWIINVLALLLATSILPGFRFDTTQPHWWTVALILPVEFALLLILLRPLLLFLTFPLNTLTLGFPTLLFNGVILWLAAKTQPSFIIDSFLDALVGLGILTVITTSLVGWLGIDEAYPFFQSVIYRLGRRFGPPRQREIKRGLLILQIDGLSFDSLTRALDRGRMPTLSAMLAKGSHRLHRWNCGLPSNTPAVQAGLFYGARAEVPGYRWYDRKHERVRVASQPEDLRILEKKAAASGQSLLAGGSCINSFMSGGAAKRLMTVTAIRDPNRERRKGEVADFNLFWLSPHAYTKAILAAVWDFATAMFWAILGRFSSGRPWVKITPRRLAQRAVAKAFLSETAYFWIKQDMIRGVPVIYSNFVGYDEVAHYSQPDAYEAQIALSAIDRKLRRLRRLMRHGTPITYEVVLLSDHGQTSSIPFAKLYRRDLEIFVAELAGLAPSTMRMHEVRPGTITYVSSLLAELQETRAGRPERAAKRGERTLRRLSLPFRRKKKKSLSERFGWARPGEAQQSAETGPIATTPDSKTDSRPLKRSEAPSPAGGVKACVSGCLAHIYFTGHPAALTLTQIHAAYPGLVEGLASHPGIGFVVARQDDGQAVVVGGGGLRNLSTSEVRGQADPLAAFGRAEVWAQELAELIGYEASGDLIVNGAWLNEGRVVVFESQSSSHGGLGGPQTEPFLLTPVAWQTQGTDLAAPERLHAHLQAGLKQLREAS